MSSSNRTVNGLYDLLHEYYMIYNTIWRVTYIRNDVELFCPVKIIEVPSLFYTDWDSVGDHSLPQSLT